MAAVEDPARGSPGADDPLAQDLCDRVAGEVVAAAPLAGLTTLRVGGSARVLVVAERDEDLAAVGAACRAHRAPWAVVGRGSNLLVADAGWPGVVLQLGRAFRGVEVDDGIVRAGAAEPLPALATRVARDGLAGFAWAAAVPGTLGGAVRMNAGAHGGQLADHLVEVDVVRLSSGTRETWPAEVLGLTYRHAALPDDAVVVDATLRLPPGAPAQLAAEIAEIRAWRREHQPLNDPNCGSVFTNPPGDRAGRLVEAVGGKDLAVGGARISDRHANFVVTRPGATAADVRTLIREIRTRVAEQFGVHLQPEVAMLGDFGDGGLGP